MPSGTHLFLSLTNNAKVLFMNENKQVPHHRIFSTLIAALTHNTPNI
jgi:hypothetical protein